VEALHRISIGAQIVGPVKRIPVIGVQVVEPRRC
jgi:hypothetical protein